MRDNINIILCDSIDNSLSNITNITDIITLNADNLATFSLVTFINGIEWSANKFGLYFFAQNLDDNLMAYLGSTEFQSSYADKKKSNGKREMCSRPNCSQSISTIKFKNIFMPGPGAYEIQVYKYEDEEMIDLSDKSNEDCIKYTRDEKLVAVYAFEVEKM